MSISIPKAHLIFVIVSDSIPAGQRWLLAEWSSLQQVHDSQSWKHHHSQSKQEEEYRTAVTAVAVVPVALNRLRIMEIHPALSDALHRNEGIVGKAKLDRDCSAIYISRSGCGIAIGMCRERVVAGRQRWVDGEDGGAVWSTERLNDDADVRKITRVEAGATQVSHIAIRLPLERGTVVSRQLDARGVAHEAFPVMRSCFSITVHLCG